MAGGMRVHAPLAKSACTIVAEELEMISGAPFGVLTSRGGQKAPKMHGTFLEAPWKPPPKPQWRSLMKAREAAATLGLQSAMVHRARSDYHLPHEEGA